MRRLGDGQRRPRTGVTRTAETVERIKQFITTNGLHPGDCLPSESDLCDGLGVSRSSVREAIRTLSTLEIVEVQHGRGTFVGNATLHPLVETLTFRVDMLPGENQQALREVIEARRGIDLGEAGQVCSALRGASDEELHRLVDRIAGARKEGEAFAELDRGFHVTLMRRAGRRIIADLVAAFWDVQAATLAKLPPGIVTDPPGAHAEILGAAEAGDVDGYRRAVHTHYEPLLERFQR
ncbi:FadR/GntR family transcriptional regulator [[Pseudopropionibacterium] massiliense]|uniref:FadR/GntR family transcriptional regulator n=1 Tax=[Pseudopropionibacterium] massiliense TaxID=2220000 RepID=UPI00103175ED|nr:GntR family transcriptional regulator [[Pseudopropionibacterium] massiliense]